MKSELFQGVTVLEQLLSFLEADIDALGQLVAEDAVLDLEKPDLPSQFPVGRIHQHQEERGNSVFTAVLSVNGGGQPGWR